MVRIEQLGTLVSEHAVENDRRRRSAFAFLVVAVAGLAIGIPLTIWYFGPWGSTAQDPRGWTGFAILPAGAFGPGVLFFQAKADVAPLGPPGVRKTHIAVALAVAARRKGFPVPLTIPRSAR
jgi:hypothetical protein